MSRILLDKNFYASILYCVHPVVSLDSESCEHFHELLLAGLSPVLLNKSDDADNLSENRIAKPDLAHKLVEDEAQAPLA